MANINAALDKLIQGALRRPYVSGAALVTPALLANDDRGYLPTAAVTTPVIFGLSGMGVGLFSSLPNKLPNMGFTKGAMNKAVNTVTGGAGIFGGPLGSNKAYMDQYLSMAPKKARDYQREAAALKKYFYKHFGVSTDRAERVADMLLGRSRSSKHYLKEHQAILNMQRDKNVLLSNALQAAAYDSFSPLEFSVNPPKKTFSALEGNSAITGLFEQYIDRPEFVQSLQHRLRKISKLEEPTRAMYTSLDIPRNTSVTGGKFTNFAVEAEDWDFVTNGVQTPRAKWMRQVWRDNPTVVKNLRKAYNSGEIDQVRILSQRVVDRDTGSSIARGRTLAFEISKNKGAQTLMIPVPNEYGEVVLNHETNMMGVGRSFIAPNKQAYRVDEMLSSLIAGEWGSAPSFKDLDQVVKSGAIWAGADPLNPFKSQVVSNAMGDGRLLSSRATAMLNASKAVPVPLPIYGLKGNQHLDDLSAGELRAFQSDLLKSGRFTQVNPDKSYQLVLQDESLRKIHPFARPDVFKQDSFYRSFTKDVRVTGDYSGNYSVSAQNALFEGQSIPQIRTQVAGIAPQDKAFFANMPRTGEDFQAKKPFILEDLRARGMSDADAAATLSELEDIYSKGNQGVFSKFGQMGETELITDPRFADKFGVETSMQYKVAGAYVQAGDNVAPNTTLGMMSGTPGAPNFGGVVESVEADAHGNMNIRIKHNLGLNGSKNEIAGVKGLMFTADSGEQFDLIRDLTNKLSSRTGSENFIPEGVNAFGDITYFNQKVSPVESQLSILNDLNRRITSLPDSDLKSQLRSIVTNTDGMSFKDTGLEINSDYFYNLGTGEESTAKLESLVNTNRGMLEKAGEAIRSAGGSADPLFDAFAKTKTSSYEGYVLRNAFAGANKVWDHSQMFVSEHLTHTFDMETIAALHGNPAAVATMRDRAITIGGGDAKQTLDFASHLFKNPEAPLSTVFSKSEIAMTDKSLTVAENRAGTIFDPTIEKYAKPFSINLGTAEAPEYLHLPGNNAYGATAGQFEQGRYQVWSWQQDVQKAINADTLSSRTKYVNRVRQSMIEDFMTGKKSAFRPAQYDPKGLTGFLRTRTADNLFEVGIGKEQVGRIADRNIRERLLAGEDVYGMFSRQPISDMKHVKVVYDPTLSGTHTIGANEKLYRPFQADADKDPVGISFWEKGSAAEAEAIETIKPGGRQSSQIAEFERIFGSGENSLEQVFEGEVSLSKRFDKYFAGIRNPIGAAENALAARKIGAFSNILTEITEQALGNPDILTNPERASRLAYGLFDVRQVAINARKSHNPFTLDQANALQEQFKSIRNMTDPVAAGDALQQTMVNMSESVFKGSAGDVNPKRDFYASDTFRDDLREWARGRTPEARRRFWAYTNGGDITSAEQLERTTNSFKQMAETGFDDILGIAHSGSKGANMASSTVGQINEEIKNAASIAATDIRGAWQGFRNAHGGKLALGLAGIAALGVLATPLETPRAAFDRPTSNKYRPEDRIGVEDHVPSEPVAGSMAPGNPVRNIVRAPSNVNTAVVAPVQSQANTEVRMRAADKQRGIEQARLLGQLTGRGNSTTNITVRNDTRLDSLQHREKIQNIRDRA